jgi:hypothetical protein
MVVHNLRRGVLLTYPGHRADAVSHFWVGMVLSAQSLFQAVGGLIVRDKLVQAKFKSWGFKLQTLRLVHLYSGLSLWILARVQCFIGKDYVFDLYTRYSSGKGWEHRPAQTLLMVETPLIMVIYFVLEFIFWLNSGSIVDRKDMVKNSDRTNNEIVKCLNSSMLRGQLDNKFPDKLIMMFLNKIYDLSNFTHPGGQYIWEWSRWRETSRYLIGAYGDEKDYFDYMDYTHSMDAYKMLEKTYIGKLEVFPDPAKWAIWDRATGQSAYSENLPWRKSKQTKISETTDIYEFTNEDYKMNTFYSGIFVLIKKNQGRSSLENIIW